MNNFKVFIRHVLFRISFIFYKLLSFPFLFLPIHDDQIVISNYYGKGYGDNAKYINEYILENELQYKVYWLVNDKANHKFPKNIIPIKIGTFESIRILMTSKYWIDNCRKKYIPIKRKSQVYLQTWHASMGIKKIEKDASSSLSRNYLFMAKKDGEATDYMISGSDYRSELYSKSFWFNGEVLNYGTPRMDVLFEDTSKVKAKIRKQLKISKETKIALYAPTFRENESSDFYSIDFKTILEALSKKYNDVWVMVIKLHPNVTDQKEIGENIGNVFNLTDYPDMQELLMASDLLITDYSSLMFDATLLNLKCILHCPDLDNYILRNRELYFDFKQLPFLVSQSTLELVFNIMNFDEESYKKNTIKFNNIIGNTEKGNSTSKIFKEIFEWREQ